VSIKRLLNPPLRQERRFHCFRPATNRELFDIISVLRVSRTYLDGRHHVCEAVGDVRELELCYVRMLRGSVVHEQPPRQEPQHADQSRAIEHVRPTPSFQYVSAERVRGGHTDRATF